MGFKNHAQRKAVWASRNEKKGSPAKNTKHKTLFGAEVELKDGDKAMRLIDPRKGKANYEQVFKPAVKGLISGVTNMFKDTQKLGRTGPMIPEKRMMKTKRPRPIKGIPEVAFSGLKEAVADPVQHSKKSPMNHCASDMMHSGGWQEMRKHNSPGTIGNKPAIKHNEKMRQQIGTFKMPHSPLNKGHEVKKDSLGKDEAWAQWEKGYMDRTHKFKGTKFEKPLTAEDNRREMEMERGEFMYDPKIGQIRLRKTDDADQPIERQSSMKNPFKINRAHDIEKAPDRPMSDIQKTYDDNIDYAKSKLSGDKLKSYIEEEDAMLKDWRSRKAKDAAASPLNKEGKKDACYHKVKSRVKVWPSAYASGQLVQCRKAGAANWGNKSKKK